jgi:hypothetical protein
VVEYPDGRRGGPVSGWAVIVLAAISRKWPTPVPRREAADRVEVIQGMAGR